MSRPSDAETEVKLHRTMHARVWAAEFMRITGGIADEEAMLGWFANAIMCGWDHHYWQSDEYMQAMNRIQLPEESK